MSSHAAKAWNSDPSDDDTYDAHVQATVDAMPPLRPEQITTLSALFDHQPGGDAA